MLKIADVFADCGLTTSWCRSILALDGDSSDSGGDGGLMSDARFSRDVDDTALLEKMATEMKCVMMDDVDGVTGDVGSSGTFVKAGDIHDIEALRKVNEDIENGNDLKLFSEPVTACSTDDPPHIMWSTLGEDHQDNFPEEVLLEVEVISSWEDERDDRTVIDLDGRDRTVIDLDGRDRTMLELDGRDVLGAGQEMLDAREVEHILEECNSDSSGEFSDYGSESGTENMDLSQSGTLDLTAKKVSNPPPTQPQPTLAQAPVQQATAVVNLTRAHIPTHLTGTVFDMSQAGVTGYSTNSYLHFSGGTTTSVDVIPRVDDVTAEQYHASTGLLDLSKTGQLYSDSQPRYKLGPNLGIDPTIQYKPEMDYNHNEALPSTITANHNPSKYETVVYDSECVAYRQPTTPELNELSYTTVETTDTEFYGDEEPRVKVEQNYSSQCQNIPLTVTSPDDENDSGTESISSNNSDKSRDSSKTDRKRPGRKKGQVSKVYHLWEFIRDVLADPRYCPSVIKWENEEEGIFRVIQSETAASLWGARKNNRTKMTYEKMSRSIRYSRKEGYFADIPKDKGYPKKLCFKFGQKAHGWSSKMKK